MATQRFQGAPNRFEVVAAYIYENFPNAKYIADVAGGQGMLSRILNKRGFNSEVIDPRGWPMIGVKNHQSKYEAHMADYYDLIVGLHPDSALVPVAHSALIRPVVIVPCCNFWDNSQKLGRDALLKKIGNYFIENQVAFKSVTFDFKGPQNIGLVAHN